ncbi:MAG: membrane protein [Nitrospinaceae bacterium]|nr:MAG: membrane protein [Nitrospinaceae bacterium]
MDSLGTKLAWIFSGTFLLATVVGFIPNPLVGSEGIFLTNTPHNLVHLVTAVAFLIVAKMGNVPSIRFMQIFGPVYLLVGLIGFAVTGTSSTGMLLGFIHINALDNFLHLGLGAAIFSAGTIANNALKLSNRPTTA